MAQAAHAVHQQAASLHAAAEVHAAKAHAATSQVQSLQATAQVGARCRIALHDVTSIFCGLHQAAAYVWSDVRVVAARLCL